jgi:hypothetical protein
MPKPRKLPERQCTATSKRTGKRCRCAAMHGYERCPTHNALLPADARFGSRVQAREAATGVERRYPRLRETIEKEVEERAQAIVGAAIESLQATSLTVDREGDEHVHPDHLTRLRAADTLMQRALGRPSSEQTIHTDVQAVVVGLNGADPEIRERISELLGRRPVSPHEPAPRSHPVSTHSIGPVFAGQIERASVQEPDSQQPRDDGGGVAGDGQNGPGSVREGAAAAPTTHTQSQSPDPDPDDGSDGAG